jgi:hypothetical protein
MSIKIMGLSVSDKIGDGTISGSNRDRIGPLFVFAVELNTPLQYTEMNIFV